MQLSLQNKFALSINAPTFLFDQQEFTTIKMLLHCLFPFFAFSWENTQFTLEKNFSKTKRLIEKNVISRFLNLCQFKR